MRLEARGPAGPFDRRREVAGALAARHERLDDARRRLLEPRPFPLLPTLELAGSGDEESVEEWAAVQFERTVELLGGDGRVERGDVAPDAGFVEPNLLVTAGDDGIRAEGAAQDVKRLTQRGAGRREVESLRTRPRRLALLAYLAAATRRGRRRRDTLLALFWPGEEAL